MRSGRRKGDGRTHRPSPSRPWVVWIQELTGYKSYVILVIKPQYRHFPRLAGRWRHTSVVHVDGPIYWKDEADKQALVQPCVEVGVSHVPPGQRYQVVFSLAEMEDLVSVLWKPPAKHMFSPSARVP